LDFVEKVVALAEAREVLGVGHGANSDEIRAAWKRMAFETHPDRNGGTRSAFDRAKAAYALLLGEQPGTRPLPETGRPGTQRPMVKVRVEKLSREAIDDCERMLREEDGFPDAAPRREVVNLDTGERGGCATGHSATDHVPTAVEREGRNLSFVVAGALSKGVNRVAIPSAEFRDRRKVEPRIVIFTSNKSGSGQVTIPLDILQDVVPGARSVKIRFAGTGGEKDDVYNEF
jgi:hypothetical protein